MLYTYIASCAPVQFRIILDVVVQPMSRFTIHILYLFRCPPTSWLRASSPSTASIVSCAAFAVSQSMPSCSTDVSLRHTSTKGFPQCTRCRGQTNLYAPGSSSPIADHFISHKDTSDWSSADPYSRASTALKKLISRLRDILQGRYTTDPCHYCIVSVAAMHYC